MTIKGGGVRKNDFIFSVSSDPGATVGWGAVVFLLLLLVLWAIFRSWRDRRKPVQKLSARVLKKGQDIYGGWGASGGTHYYSHYRIMFQVAESEEELLFPVSLTVYAMLKEGQTGTLTFRGRTFLGFQGDAPETPSQIGATVPAGKASPDEVGSEFFVDC